MYCRWWKWIPSATPLLSLSPTGSHSNVDDDVYIVLRAFNFTMVT
jgi:hypothetical protein